MGTEKHPKGLPKLDQHLVEDPTCDLIPAQAMGQEGSCNTYFPCTKTREEGDTSQAEEWQPEYKVTCMRDFCIDWAILGRILCLG